MTNFLSQRRDLEFAAVVEPQREVVEVVDVDGERVVYIAEPVSVGSEAAVGSGYRHVQLASIDVWTITHPLGYRPAGVIVRNSVGEIVEPADIAWPDDNTVIINLNGRPMSGQVDLS